MLQLAQRRAEELGRHVTLRLGDAQALDLPDASFDAVVCTLSPCAIPDERRAIAEMRRVLRPGGRLLLLDHVAPRHGWAGRYSGCWSALRSHWVGGEHLRRRPLLQVQSEGFEVGRRERYKLGVVERLAARKPSDPDARAIGDGGR
jgi:SAM-dependent methyltransferase